MAHDLPVYSRAGRNVLLARKYVATGEPNPPPGHTAANRATRNAEGVEPPAPAVQSVTAAQALQQADEMLSLAQQVRADTERATQGVLAKDLKDKLKRIEKLSKKLREELTPQ